MDPTRDLYQIGQENPRVPSSSEFEVEEDLFHQIFDWPTYSNDTQPWDTPSHPFSSPQHLDKLITDIHPLIDSLEHHRFFRMRTPFGSDDEVVTTSDYSGHPSPPELVQGEGSTSPSDHSGPVLPEQYDEPYQRAGISLHDFREHDDKWTYPQRDPTKGSGQDYAHSLRVHNGAGSSRHSPSSQGLSPKASSTVRISGKRPRQLENPDQTADVRKSGACLPCRVSKTRCHENGVCPTCRKAFPDHSHLVCARKNLHELWPVMTRGPDVWAREPTRESQYCSSQSRIFTGKPKPISVFFTRDPDGPALSAYVQPYRWKDESEHSQLEKAAFSRDHPLKHEHLQRWVEHQIKAEKTSDFPRAVRRFVMDYSREGYGLPKHGLVSKIHQLACFFRIWRTPSFWCRDPSGKIVALPLSVQAQLRTIVVRAVHSIEYDILKELDSLTTPNHLPKTDDKLALWAGLWQLILMYRDLTTASAALLARTDLGPSNGQSYALHAQYQGLIKSFFPLITIFYHYQFRTKKSLELSLDWMKSSKYSSRRSSKIEHSGKTLLESRKHFLQYLQTSESEVDRLLCIFVVNHELKKLNARKRAPKTSKSKSSKRGADDDCDDDAD